MAGGICFLRKVKASGEKGTGQESALGKVTGGSLWEGEV